ncbi:MAG: nitrogen regulation protein NR(II) [Candidatus Binatia bacterium]
MKAGQTMRGRHAECAYLLDRAVKNPASTEEFARAALDSIRLALRPAYAALMCRGGSYIFRCGDQVLAADVDAAAEILMRAPRSLLVRPRAIRRGEAAGLSVAPLDPAMAAAAFELVFPISDDGVLLGVVALGPRPDRTPYSCEDLEFCNRVGARIAVLAARETLAAEVASLRAASLSSERLASVGRMAAGLAHEIRNPLVSIRTFTQLLPERHADEEFRSTFLDLTLSEIDRISTLVGEILSYARPAEAACDDDSAASTDLADCVERTCLLLRSHARSAGVMLEFECAELAERAAFDEDKLRQVVINLVVNGIQACDGRGRVRVAALPRPSGGLEIEVSDDGPGMPADVAARIFEPFFTTRREGTGLGLAMVKSLLDDAGASIAVETAPGGGTTFRIGLLTVGQAARESVQESARREALRAEFSEPQRREPVLAEPMLTEQRLAEPVLAEPVL